MPDRTPGSAAPIVLAFDIGGTRIKAGLIQAGAVVHHRVVATPTDTLATLLAVLGSLAHDLARETTYSLVGLSVKGIVDAQQGRVLDINESLLYLNDVPLRDRVATLLGCPVTIDNDARLFALGEWLFGAGRGVRDLVCLTLGTGVGCGVIVDGQLLHGGLHTAGILGGHISVRSDGPRCTCGNLGCLEACISTQALLRQAAALQLHRASQTVPITVADIFSLAQAGEPTAQDIVAEFTQTLSVGIVSLVHAFGAERVVIGGGIAQASMVFLPAIQRYAQMHLWTALRGRVTIVSAQHPDHAALLGVAQLALQQHMSA